MKRAQFAFGHVSDFAVLVDLFQIDEERAVCMRRSNKKTHDRMAGDLDVGFEWSAGVSEQLFVFLVAIRVDDLAADLRVPAVFRPVVASKFTV